MGISVRYYVSVKYISERRKARLVSHARLPRPTEKRTAFSAVMSIVRNNSATVRVNFR